MSSENREGKGAPGPSDVPLIISVDDHVCEPPDLWSSRLPSKYSARGPKVVRRKLKSVGGSKGREWRQDDDGAWCDAWEYDASSLYL